MSEACLLCCGLHARSSIWFLSSITFAVQWILWVSTQSTEREYEWWWRWAPVMDFGSTAGVYCVKAKWLSALWASQGVIRMCLMARVMVLLASISPPVYLNTSACHPSSFIWAQVHFLKYITAKCIGCCICTDFNLMTDYYITNTL